MASLIYTKERRDTHAQREKKRRKWMNDREKQARTNCEKRDQCWYTFYIICVYTERANYHKNGCKWNFDDGSGRGKNFVYKWEKCCIHSIFARASDEWKRPSSTRNIMTDWHTESENKSIHTHPHTNSRTHPYGTYTRAHTHTDTCYYFSATFKCPITVMMEVLTEPKHVTYRLICLYAYVYRCYDVRWWMNFYWWKPLKSQPKEHFLLPVRSLALCFSPFFHFAKKKLLALLSSYYFRHFFSLLANFWRFNYVQLRFPDKQPKKTVYL